MGGRAEERGEDRGACVCLCVCVGGKGRKTAQMAIPSAAAVKELLGDTAVREYCNQMMKQTDGGWQEPGFSLGGAREEARGIHVAMDWSWRHQEKCILGPGPEIHNMNLEHLHARK